MPIYPKFFLSRSTNNYNLMIINLKVVKVNQWPLRIWVTPMFLGEHGFSSYLKVKIAVLVHLRVSNLKKSTAKTFVIPFNWDRR